MNFQEYAILNARGTLIQIPVDVAKISPVLEKWVTGDWKDSRSSYFLNYSSEVVHSFLDNISVAPVKQTPALKAIMKELMVKQGTYPPTETREEMVYLLLPSTNITKEFEYRVNAFTSEGWKCGSIVSTPNGFAQIMTRKIQK